MSCVGYRISNINATDMIKQNSAPGKKPGQLIYIHMLTTAADQSLTPKSIFSALMFTGMTEESTDSRIAASSKIATEN